MPLGARIWNRRLTVFGDFVFLDTSRRGLQHLRESPRSISPAVFSKYCQQKQVQSSDVWLRSRNPTLQMGLNLPRASWGPRTSFGPQFRFKIPCSFGWWCFQSDPGTLCTQKARGSIPNKNKFYFCTKCSYRDLNLVDPLCNMREEKKKFFSRVPRPKKECSDRFDFIINRKSMQFWFEIHIRNFFQLRIFFEKGRFENQVEIFWSILAFGKGFYSKSYKDLL